MTSPVQSTVAARLDRLPAAPSLRRMIAVLSMGGWFEFYDIFLPGYIAPGLYRSGIFTPSTIASFVAVFFAGLFFGTLLLSRLSDRFGRRAMFNFSMIWYSTCSFIMAFQSTAGALEFWRFAAGLGVGVELVTMDTYLSEIVPKEIRGTAFAFNQFVTFLAVPFVALMAFLLVPKNVLGLDGWRWVVLIGSLGALLVFVIRRIVPESPRWLAQVGRTAEAESAMDRIEARIETEIGRPLPDPQTISGEATRDRGRFSEIWEKPYARRTIMLMIFNLCQAIGFYGFANWVPTFLLSKGISAVKSLEYTFIIAIANPVGPLLGRFFADKFERKWQIVWPALLVAGFGLLFSQQKEAFGVIAFGILVTLGNNWMSFSFHAYQAELYPTRIRSLGVGFVYSWSRLGAWGSSFVIAFVLTHQGSTGVFCFIGAAMLVVAISIGWLGPATTHQRLEQIAP